MGRVCFAGSQLARGAAYLDRAHALRPTDVEVNYLLGRYWMERGDFARGALYLLQAADSPEALVTSTQTPLSSFYLGIALQQAGYHLAAGTEFARFLERVQRPIAGYRYDAELNFLMNMSWSAHLAAAENFARAGDFRAALTHYRAANADRPDDAFISSRMVHALVRDGQAEKARQAALGLLTSARGSDDAVKLVDWTYTALGKKADLVRDVTAHLNTPGRTENEQEADAITLAAALDYLGRKAEAFATLAAYCEAHPAQVQALGRLLKRVDSAETFDRALGAAARTIASDPARAEDVVQLFTPVAESGAGGAYLKSSPPVTGDYARLYLLGLTRRAHDAPASAVEQALRESVRASPPEFFAGRQALVGQLLSTEKFAEADQVVHQLVPAGSDRVWQLRIDTEAAQQRLVSAMTLAREARTRFPQNADIRLQLIAICRMRGMETEAETELQALVRDFPKLEAGYRMLVNALFSRSRRGVSADATTAAVIALTNRLLSEVPDSRFARVTAAVVYGRQGRFEDAEVVLRSVLANDPDIAEALLPLAQLRQLTGKNDGPALLEASLKRKPQVEVARSLAAMYRETDRGADILALARRLAEENPDSEPLAAFRVTELLAQDQRDEAVTCLEAGMKKFPASRGFAMTLARIKDEMGDHTGAIALLRNFMEARGESTEVLYLLGHLYAEAGQEDASVASLQRILAIMPDHIGANNDLGYFWTNAGIHLDLAEPMINKALQNKPGDASFIDSLGWLYYKQGRFDDAVSQLERAAALPGGAQAEVIRHLGDALYRQNRAAEAIERWAEALQRLSVTESMSRNDRAQRDYLNTVLTEARAGRPVPVSPVAVPAAPRSAGPTTTAPAGGAQ
jgi:tetratricopeptide (TPR) repeat protein